MEIFSVFVVMHADSVDYCVDNLSAEGGFYVKIFILFNILPVFLLFAVFPAGIVDNSAGKSVSCETFQSRYPHRTNVF